MNRAELKDLAKEQIKGNLGMLFVCVLITGAVAAVLQLIPVVGAVGALFASPTLAVGTCMVYLNLAQGEDVSIKTLFAYINNCVTCFLTSLLTGVFVFLWSLLLVVPGIIKSFSYSMVFYILAENPDLSPLDAINESKRIMDGHKMELFVLSLSFIGWMILTSITCGIAGVYTVPYMGMTMTNFYNTIKGPVVYEGIE